MANIVVMLYRLLAAALLAGGCGTVAQNPADASVGDGAVPDGVPGAVTWRNQPADELIPLRTVHRLAPGERLTRRVSLERSFGWYDFTLRADSDPAFRRQLAGHLETGHDSMSDPALGR